MDHDSIMEIIEETIQERSATLCSSADARNSYEQAEFGSGYTIITLDDEDKIKGSHYVQRT